MFSTFFSTTDGDIILRAGTEPNSKHDFRVHKFILSLASPVFKDMFAFPQPPEQTSNQLQLSVVDVLDPPEVLDAVLRFIYPGVEPPKVTELSPLSALLSTADKYNIASIYPTLREILKTFLPGDPIPVYTIACRFGFSEEAREAANLSGAGNSLYYCPLEDIQHVSSSDIFRLFQFIRRREFQGRLNIGNAFEPWRLDVVDCKHGEQAKDFYFRLRRAVEEEFALKPWIGSKGLLPALDRISDPPPGCTPPSGSGEWYGESSDEDDYKCPLQPMIIRRRLTGLAKALTRDNGQLLDEFFREGVEGG